MSLETNVYAAPIAKSLSRDQLKRVRDYMALLRETPATVVKVEADRLDPYFGAMAKQVAADLAASKRWQGNELIEGFVNPSEIRRLFTAVAAHTHNAILSEIMIMPFDMLVSRNLRGYSTVFTGEGAATYNGEDYALGFVQSHTKEKGGSVSIPVFGFSRQMMRAVQDLEPEKMYQCFQSVFSAGNHDMLHHFTNMTLSPKIARCALYNDIVETNYAVGTETWANISFPDLGDSEPGNYEGWLMYNHRTTNALLPEEQKEALAKGIETYFDELKRMTSRLPKDKACKVTDYFGTMLCFSLMRFLPFNAPEMRLALDCFEKSLPDKKHYLARADEIEKKARYDIDKRRGLEQLVIKDMGVGLPPRKMRSLTEMFSLKSKKDFKILKQGELLANWGALAYLQEPAKGKGELAKGMAQAARGDIFLHMLLSSAFCQGAHYIKKPISFSIPSIDGGVNQVEARIINGGLAIVENDGMGTMRVEYRAGAVKPKVKYTYNYNEI